MYIDRMHMTATADGRVVALGVEDATGDHILIDDGEVEELGSDREAALAELTMRGGKHELKRATAEALLAGDDARCAALARSCERVLKAAEEA